MKKSIIIVPLILTSLSTNQCLSFASTKANDISGHWAEKIIIEWQAKNKISGYEDNSFRPDCSISRAEFVHLLNSIIPIEQNEFTDFNDVSSIDWFYTDVIKAASNHIIAGFEDNTFHPNEAITRAQAALMISNALHITNSTNENKITITDDSDIPEWSKDAVYALLNVGYLSGYEDGSFGAHKNMTRAEALSMFDRIDKQINQSKMNNENTTNETNDYDNIANQKSSSNIEEKTPSKMVWENGGGRSSYSTSKNKDTKPPEDTENIITINKDNISDFYGKTIENNVILELAEDSIELTNMKLTGNVEIVSKVRAYAIPTLYLKGNTTIKHITVSSPIIINSENNVIKTLITNAETTISGNTQIENLQCYAKTNMIENTNITDTVQIASTLTADYNTKINIVELIANAESNITTNGMINKIITSGKGNISYIHLTGNTDTTINIMDSVIVENITLSENAKANITVQKNSELKKLLSSSNCLGTTITNYGTVESISAINEETITAENTTIAPIALQNIIVLSQPHHLQYNEGDILSLAGISLLLQYENNITQTINNIDDFDLYHIKTVPTQNAILTAAYHNQPIKIYCDNQYTNTNAITINSITKEIINIQPLTQLIEQCKTILNQTHIKTTEDNILEQQYYIDEDDFNSFKNTISISEKLLSKTEVTQNEVQQQYTVLQTALQEFESKRTLAPKAIPAPALSISNTSPEYGAENVTFTIENIDQNLTYYYTLDGSDPTIESQQFTSDVTLVPPEETTETTITIKAIAVQDEICSTITEQTVTYSAALPIEEVILYNLKTPSIGEMPENNIKSEKEQQYTIQHCTWKEKEPSDNENDEKIETFSSDENNQITDSSDDTDNTEIKAFEAEKTYIAEIHLTSVKPYAFDMQSDIELKLKGIANENGEYASIDEKLENIEIDEQHSDANNLCVLVTFQPTLPQPTAELAQIELKKIEKLMLTENREDRITVSVPSSKANESDCNEAIAKAVQPFISEHWEVTFQSTYFFANKIIASATGNFTVTSKIDKNISVTSNSSSNIEITIEPEQN